MDNLLRIAAKEIRVALRERIVLALGGIVVLLLGVALYGGYLAYQQQREVITETQREKRQEWLEQGDKHPHIAAHYGTYAFKPKTTLSLFDFGLDAYTGTSVYLEAHYQHEFMFRPAQDHSSMIRFGELSAALILRVLVPLLVIFLAFATYTRERESGTLKLLLSQGVSLRTLTWGKILAYITLLTLVLTPFLVAIVILALLGYRGAPVMPDLGMRSVLLLVVYGVYVFLFIALSVWVSLHLATGRNALLTLLSCWILFAVLMPKAVANFGERLYPLPSMRQFKAAIEESKTKGLDGKTTRTVRLAALEKQYLTEYGVDSVQQLPFNFDGVSMQAGEEFGNGIYDHHLNDLRGTFYRQDRLGGLASLVNPALAVERLSMALAGTDLYTFTHFEEQVENYRRELVRKMNADMAENSAFGEFYGYKAGGDLWEQIDDFVYQTPPAGALLRHYWLACLSLLVWVIGTLLLINHANRNVKPLHE